MAPGTPSPDTIAALTSGGAWAAPSVAAAAAYAACTSTPCTSSCNTLTRCSIPAPAACRAVWVGHHLPGLRGHVRAADQLAVLIDGVLAADIHHHGAGEDHSDMAEGRAHDQSPGRNNWISVSP